MSIWLGNTRLDTDVDMSAYAKDSDVIHKTGDEFIAGNKTFANTVTFLQIINGTAMNAQWADLAEYYEADKEYEPGTLLQVGGEKEVTIATDRCNLIVSTKPGFILNQKQEEGWLLCALAGRVPVLVDCEVHKGDKLYLSLNTPGKASNIENGKCIAVALEDGSVSVNALTKISL